MTDIVVENVSYRYKHSDKFVLKNVSCQFMGGKLSVIVGPSGSGKTTLLSLLAGLDKATSGEIILNGESINHLDLDQYRRESVSIIFQAFHLFPLLTGFENVCFPMILNGGEKEKINQEAERILDLVGISKEKSKRYPSNLSGGEQQRIAIGRALATGARVILADEPTGNLDKDNGENILGILQGLAQEQNYCVITVTHDQEISLKADKVWAMNEGVITED